MTVNQLLKLLDSLPDEYGDTEVTLSVQRRVDTARWCIIGPRDHTEPDGGVMVMLCDSIDSTTAPSGQMCECDRRRKPDTDESGDSGG